MRPTVTTEHRRRADKLAADVQAYIDTHGPIPTRPPTDRAKPPVDLWHDRIAEDYRTREGDSQ